MSESTKPDISTTTIEDKSKPEVEPTSEVGAQPVTAAIQPIEPMELMESMESIEAMEMVMLHELLLPRVTAPITQEAVPQPSEDPPKPRPPMMVTSAPVPLISRPGAIAIPQQRSGIFEFNPVAPSWGTVSKSWDSVPIKRITEFNGDIGAEAAMALAMRLSTESVPITPQSLYMDFMKEWTAHRFKSAFAIFDAASDEVKMLIRSTLDITPWRISCEYHLVDGRVKWYNTWIKIGWWSSVAREISPQLQKVRWTQQHTGSLSTIDGSSFYCTVWKGIGGEMLRRLLTSNNPINVKLEFHDGVLTPIDFSCIGTVNPQHMFDLASIEIGSLDSIPNGNQELDATRTHHRTDDHEAGIQRLFYRGSPMGAAIRSELIDDIYPFEDDEDFGEDFDEYYEYDENEGLDADGDLQVLEQIEKYERNTEVLTTE